MGGDVYRKLKDGNIDKVFIEQSQFLSSEACDVNFDSLHSNLYYYFKVLHDISDYSKIYLYKKPTHNKSNYVKVAQLDSTGEKELVIICDKELVSLVKTSLSTLDYHLDKPRTLKK